MHPTNSKTHFAAPQVPANRPHEIAIIAPHASGKTIPIPRHPRDLGRRLLRKILREAGLNMGLEEFSQR